MSTISECTHSFKTVMDSMREILELQGYKRHRVLDSCPQTAELLSLFMFFLVKCHDQSPNSSPVIRSCLFTLQVTGWLFMFLKQHGFCTSLMTNNGHFSLPDMLQPTATVKWFLPVFPPCHFSVRNTKFCSVTLCKRCQFCPCFPHCSPQWF